MPDIYDQLKCVKYTTSHRRLSSTGVMKEKSSVSKPEAVTDDTCLQTSMKENTRKRKNQQPQPSSEEKSVTAESPHQSRKKIYLHKENSFSSTTQITKLSQILDLASISKEKALKPYWNQQSKEMSQRLWLPTETDFAVSVLTSSRTSSIGTPLGKSWFSIKEKHPRTESSLMTSFQSSQYSLLGSTVSEATPSDGKSEKRRKVKKEKTSEEEEEAEKVRTLKIRIFPTDTQKTELDVMFNQFRWYYNTSLDLLKLERKDKQRLSFFTERDNTLKKYRYEERRDGEYAFIDYIRDDNIKKTITPPWWEKNTGSEKLHNRIPSSAMKLLVAMINSSVSNRKGKNFVMKHMTKREMLETIQFDDKNFPAMIRNIKSRYCFRIKNGDRKRRKYISFSDIWKSTKQRAVTLIHEKPTDRYFLHYPVNREWYPSDDIRSDNQTTSAKTNRIISLDPGIRKFLVGYDPNGKSVLFGKGASLKLENLILEEDKEKDYSKRKHIRNMVNEMHWKSIRYLTTNYDTIVYPDFRVSQMVKGRKLKRMTKRLMLMFCFHSFKEKLQYKCDCLGKKLYIVDESFTSRTCSQCGRLNDTGGSEKYHCIGCGMRGDRDILASRNILIKNILPTVFNL